MKSSSLLAALLTLTSAALAEPPANAKLILEDSFDRAELGNEWHAHKGDWKIADGVLRVREIPEDKHAAAARRTLATKNAVYELKFRFVGEGKGFHLGFDPAKGELDKKGHLFSVIITPKSWKIQKHQNKAKPKEDPNEVLAIQQTEFKTGEWHTLRVTCWGTHVSVRIEGKEVLKGSHPTFEVKKPTLVFRCSGDGVEIDDLKVWEQQAK